MISYFFFRILLFFISILPFRVLYLFSDFLSFFLCKIIRYRREVILTNLKMSFPDKTPDEINSILKKYYKNLSDISLEGLKGITCSQQELIKRYHFLNPGLVESFFNKGQSAIGLVAHYNNWEWGAYATAPQINGQVIGVSSPIKNPYFDRFFKQKRSRFGAKIVHMQQTARAIVKNIHVPSLFVLIADQSPSNSRFAHWLEFLNQETAFLPGPGKIARKTNYPIFYFDVQRIKRGYYEVTATLLHERPAKEDEHSITKSYATKLEAIIQKEPPNWLWSHRRWKKKRMEKDIQQKENDSTK